MAAWMLEADHRRGQKADLYAPADYLDIDLLMKPAGYST
jgi:hypothetical protein